MPSSAHRSVLVGDRPPNAQMTVYAERPMLPELALNTSSAAVNYSEYTTDISGLVSLIGRVKYVYPCSLPNTHRDLI